MILKTFLTMLAGGHLLLEDKPGVGKTTLAVAFSRALQLNYKRMQFTPDVMPTDVTGFTVFNKNTGTTEYQEGAIICNLFLADELNRASSRTQAALLEAMEEGQVTVDGVDQPLPQPFVVIATQNPTGAAGTSLLPDSQMDRFMVRLSLGYPNRKDEINMVLSRQKSNPLAELSPIFTADQVAQLQELVAQTHVGEAVVSYIIDLIHATRCHGDILRGASPRATLALTAMAKSIAQLRGRDYVVPVDVKDAFPATIAHRLLLTPKAESRNISPEELLRQILERTPSPKLR
jgi:MoxR-like ATPase